MFNSLTKLANLTFALTVDPDNEALKNYSNKVNELRTKALATIPISIKLKKQINPFLRCHESSLQCSAKQFDAEITETELDTFTTIRRWKDQF